MESTNCLHRLEHRTAYSAKQCARLLGVAYSTYAAYRAGSLPIPSYVALHADTLVRISGDLLLELVRERVS